MSKWFDEARLAYYMAMIAGNYTLTNEQMADFQQLCEAEKNTKYAKYINHPAWGDSKKETKMKKYAISYNIKGEVYIFNQLALNEIHAAFIAGRALAFNCMIVDVKEIVEPKPRYEVHACNHVRETPWGVFDREVTYMISYHGSQKDAQNLADILNSKALTI